MGQARMKQNLFSNQRLLVVVLLFLIILCIQIGYIHSIRRRLYEFPQRNVKKNIRAHTTDQFPTAEPSSHLWKTARQVFDKTAKASNTLSPFCKELPELKRLKDPTCHAEWINHLKYASIVDIDIMLGFEKGKQNAFRVVFEDGSYGWYKTCPAEGENPEKEIIGYALNHLLQFNMMAPAISRPLHIQKMERLVRDAEFKELLAQTDYSCSAGDYFPGIMIGWWPNLEETRSLLKKKNAEESEGQELRNEWNSLARNASYPIQEMPRNHIFMFLLNILQNPGHNEFRVKDESLVCVDVDRAEFMVEPGSSSSSFGLSYLCKLDLRTYSLLQEAGKAMDENRISPMLRNLLDLFAMDSIFTVDHGHVLQARIKYLTNMMETCIERFGYENVIFDL